MKLFLEERCRRRRSCLAERDRRPWGSSVAFGLARNCDGNQAPCVNGVQWLDLLPSHRAAGYPTSTLLELASWAKECGSAS